MNIRLYTKTGCSYCINALNLLNSLNKKFEVYELDPKHPLYNRNKETLFNHYNYSSFPVVLIDNKLIGGFTELKHFLVK